MRRILEQSTHISNKDPTCLECEITLQGIHQLLIKFHAYDHGVFPWNLNRTFRDQMDTTYNLSSDQITQGYGRYLFIKSQDETSCIKSFQNLLKHVSMDRFEVYVITWNIDIPEGYDSHIFQFALGGYRTPANYFKCKTNELDQVLYQVPGFSYMYYQVPIPVFLAKSFVNSSKGDMYQFNSETLKFDSIKNRYQNRVNCYQHPFNAVVRYYIRCLVEWDWWIINYQTNSPHNFIQSNLDQSQINKQWLFKLQIACTNLPCEKLNLINNQFLSNEISLWELANDAKKRKVD